MNQNLPQTQSESEESILSRGAINVIRDYYQSWKHKKKQTPTKPSLTWRERIALLTVSQWMYVAAAVTFALMSDGNKESEETRIYTVGLIAGIGLSREIWNLFHRMWNTTFGKGVFLVLYAATANFALAIAAVKVNAISGIEPAPLRFTLGFTTLIMLPLWIFVASIILAAFMLMAGNLWLLVSMMLRIIRIKVPAHWDDKSFAFISMLLRIFLIPIVIGAMGLVFRPYVEQVSNILEIPIEVVDADLSEEEERQIRALPQEERVEAVRKLVAERDRKQDELPNDETATEEERARRGTLTISVVPDEERIAQSLSDEPDMAEEDEEPEVIDKLIASFIYNMETYRYSVCSKAPNQRVLTIDENSVLLAERDDSPLGYKFSVAACDHTYNQTKE